MLLLDTIKPILGVTDTCLSEHDKHIIYFVISSIVTYIVCVTYIHDG